MTQTAQEIFDQVVTHLGQQREKSGTGILCQYRNHRGLQCAVGCLLTDEEYTPAMDQGHNTGVQALLEKGLLPARLHEHARLLSALQNVHDIYLPEEWPARLMLKAQNFSLKWKPELYD